MSKYDVIIRGFGDVKNDDKLPCSRRFLKRGDPELKRGEKSAELAGANSDQRSASDTIKRDS